MSGLDLMVADWLKGRREKILDTCHHSPVNIGLPSLIDSRRRGPNDNRKHLRNANFEVI